MIVSLNRLKTLVRLPDSATAAEIYEKLTFAGLEGESLRTVHQCLDGVIAAKIQVTESFDGKKVRRAELDTGSGTVQVACGDSTVQEGDVVAYAPPGTQVGDHVLAVREVAGIESAGMLVSRIELGIGGDGSGVWRLDAAPGTPAHTLEPDDAILELGVTPNRGDCFGHLGIARELAVLYDTELIAPELYDLDADTGDRTIALQDDGCPLYLGVWLTLDTPTSPLGQEIEALLGRTGMRSISPLVDLTNFVMLELGQPMHAFDADKLVGAVCVRTARTGEMFDALDGEPHELLGGELVIADDQGPIALAGVMGGARTEVDKSTTHVLLESAHFDPVRVSKARRQHGMSTESSKRFERGVDPQGVRRASQRFLKLLEESTTFQIEAISENGKPPATTTAEWRTKSAEALLGKLPETATCEKILNQLGFTPTAGEGGGENSRHVPSWRFDVAIPEDLAEEVARITGYDYFDPTLPDAPTRPCRDEGHFALRETLLDRLIRAGFQQAIHLSFQPELGDDAVALQNPLGKQTQALRTALQPGMLAAVAHNHRHQVTDVRLAELGKVFHRDGDTVRESWRLALAISGSAFPGSHHGVREADFFDLKGVIEGLLGSVTTVPRTWHPPETPAAHFHASRVADVRLGDTALGSVGQIAPATAKALDLARDVFYAELELAPVFAAATSERTPAFQPLPRFPASARDLAFVLPREIPAAEVLKITRTAAGPSLRDVHVFDVYEGPGIDPDKKSLALRLTYRHDERTLSQDEVDAATEAVVAAVGDGVGGVLR